MGLVSFLLTDRPNKGLRRSPHPRKDPRPDRGYSRTRSAAAFASYTDTAPIEVSSGDDVHHRL
jgi:hypothetical protein